MLPKTHDLRASVSGQLLFLFWTSRVYIVSWATEVAVIIAEVFGALVVIVIMATEGVCRGAVFLKIAQEALGFIVEVVGGGINGGGRVGNKVVSEVVEGVLHYRTDGKGAGTLGLQDGKQANAIMGLAGKRDV